MSDTAMQEFWVARDVDRSGERLGNPFSDFFIKVSTEDSRGSLFVLEMTNHVKGGPVRHIHYYQDEWFYIVEGEYVFEVGSQERIRLKPGDSVFGPRNVPHVWAFVGDTPGRILFIFTPAAQIEPFFREIGAVNAPPPLDPAIFHRYGMKMVGPPLDIK